MAVLAARAGLDANQTAGGQVDAQVGRLVDLDRVGQVDAGRDVQRLAGPIDGGNGAGKTVRLLDLAGGVSEEAGRVDDAGRRGRGDALFRRVDEEAARRQIVDLDDE